MRRVFAVIVFVWIGVSRAAAQEVCFATDFETDDGGWIESGFGDWERGPVVPGVFEICDTAPRPEPTGAVSGTNVFATNLNGCYTNSGASNVLSQTFDFTSLVAPITLRWQQFYEVFLTFDTAEVRVNGDLVFEVPDAAATPDYVEQTVDLSAYAGLAAVTITFDLAATTVVNRSGWYLDDIEIEAASCAGVVDCSLGDDDESGSGADVVCVDDGDEDTPN